MTPARPVTGTPEGNTDTTTVHFNYRGVAYTIDLDPSGIVEFETALAPYTSAARQVGGIRRRTNNETSEQTQLHQ